MLHLPYVLVITYLFYAVSTPIAFEDNSQGSLQQDEQVRLQYDIPESGATFELSVEQGTIVFYASTMITSPNEAFHEWKAQTSDSTSVYIKPTPAATGQNEKSLNTDLFRSQDTNVTIQLYVAMLGLDANNTFTLKSKKIKRIMSNVLFTFHMHILSLYSNCWFQIWNHKFKHCDPGGDVCVHSAITSYYSILNSRVNVLNHV